MSILDELQSLVANAEQVKAREDQMLGMFELAGFELEHPAPHNPDDNTDYENELLTEDDPECFNSVPKTLIELLSEALGNPPTEPGSWIRIQDIPRYISENLVVPDREVLEAFNSSVQSQTTMQEPAIAALPAGWRALGPKINSPREAINGGYYACVLNRIWRKEDSDQWTFLEEPDDVGGYLDIDVQGPLRAVAQGGHANVPVRNRNPVL